MISDSQYGICHLSVIPLKKEPSDTSEIGSQLLFGDAFTILKTSQDGKWVYVKNAYDGYLGWIDSKQYKPISADYFDLLDSVQSPLSSEMVGLLQGENGLVPILMGTTLPFFKDDTVVIENDVYKYKGAIHFPAPVSDFRFLKKMSYYYLNAPYLWGGRTHFGIDCSGFVQQLFRFIGHKLPRDAYQQAEAGTLVAFGEQKPGDLAFFQDGTARVTHVGLILENDQIIHASGQVRIDVLDEKGIMHSGKKSHSHKFHSIRRILS